jgi:hypothetical protein
MGLLDVHPDPLATKQNIVFEYKKLKAALVHAKNGVFLCFVSVLWMRLFIA